jgi:SAM-dependent methyltransferase
MDYKETYEKFWEKSKWGQFETYPRNLILPDFFPVTDNYERVCDVAGGAGIVSRWLVDRGYDVSLVEFCDNAVAEAQSRGIEKIFHNQISGLNSLPFGDSYFDMVFFGDIIEHLFDGESALREIKRILKSDGKLILSCPNIAYWRFRMYYLWDGDFHRIDVAKQDPWEQEHIRFYNIQVLKRFLSLLNFEFVCFKGSNNIWHSKYLANIFPHLFANTIVAEFKNIK